MTPLLRYLCAWGCWWEIRGDPRSRSAAAFVAPPVVVVRHGHHCTSQAPRCDNRFAAAETPGCRTGGRLVDSRRSCSLSRVDVGARGWRGRRRDREGNYVSPFPKNHRVCDGLLVLAGASSAAATPSTASHADRELVCIDGGSSGSSARRLPGLRRRAKKARVLAAPETQGADEEEKSAAHGWEGDSSTVGGWLRLAPRDTALLRRKVPSFRKQDRWNAVMARKLLDEGEDQGHVVDVLRGPQLGFTAEECKKVVLKHPDMLTMNGTGPSSRLAWMERSVELDREQLRGIVLKQPKLLSNSIDVNMAPVVEFLVEELGLPLEKIGAIIRKFPEVLNLSVERTLVAKVRWFEKTLEMERSDIARMVSTLPVLFGYSIEDNMEPKIAWLQKALGASRQTALGMMVKWPGLFTCNIDRNLQPTLDFFRDDLYGEPDQVRDVVIQNPRLLGASIEKRMRPRAGRMLAKGVVARFSEHRWMLCVRTDAKFEAWLDQLRPDATKGEEEEEEEEEKEDGEGSEGF